MKVKRNSLLCIRRELGRVPTHSDCRSSESSSFPRILTVKISKVQNCSIIPCQWAQETYKKTEDGKIITTPEIEKMQKKIWDFTYENHPIPHPKQGRGLSYNPSWESSSSLIRVYLPFSLSESAACPIRMQQYVRKFGIKQNNKGKG